MKNGHAKCIHNITASWDYHREDNFRSRIEQLEHGVDKGGFGELADIGILVRNHSA